MFVFVRNFFNKVIDFDHFHPLIPFTFYIILLRDRSEINSPPSSGLWSAIGQKCFPKSQSFSHVSRNGHSLHTAEFKAPPFHNTLASKFCECTRLQIASGMNYDVCSWAGKAASKIRCVSRRIDVVCCFLLINPLSLQCALEVESCTCERVGKPLGKDLLDHSFQIAPCLKGIFGICGTRGTVQYRPVVLTEHVMSGNFRPVWILARPIAPELISSAKSRMYARF